MLVSVSCILSVCSSLALAGNITQDGSGAVLYDVTDQYISQLSLLVLSRGHHCRHGEDHLGQYDLHPADHYDEAALAAVAVIQQG